MKQVKELIKGVNVHADSLSDRIGSFCDEWGLGEEDLQALKHLARVDFARERVGFEQQPLAGFF